MLPNNYLTISMFGKLTQIPRKTLIYYDTIGLLKPEFVGDNGYRYYSLKQIEISYIIIVFRSLDMPLDEIKAYLNNRTPELGLKLFQDQRVKIDARIKHLQGLKKYIEHQITTTTEGFEVVFDAPSLEFSDQALYFVSDFNVTFETALSSPLVSEFFDTLFAIDAIPNYNIGLLYQAKSSQSHKREFQLTLRASEFEPRMRQVIKQKGTYLKVYHPGTPESFDQYIDLLNQFAATHGYRLDDTYFYDYIWDEIVVEDRKHQICKISVRVLT